MLLAEQKDSGCLLKIGFLKLKLEFDKFQNFGTYLHEVNPARQTRNVNRKLAGACILQIKSRNIFAKQILDCNPTGMLILGQSYFYQILCRILLNQVFIHWNDWFIDIGKTKSQQSQNIFDLNCLTKLVNCIFFKRN